MSRQPHGDATVGNRRQSPAPYHRKHRGSTFLEVPHAPTVKGRREGGGARRGRRSEAQGGGLLGRRRRRMAKARPAVLLDGPKSGAHMMNVALSPSTTFSTCCFVQRLRDRVAKKRVLNRRHKRFPKPIGEEIPALGNCALKNAIISIASKVWRMVLMN